MLLWNPCSLSNKILFVRSFYINCDNSETIQVLGIVESWQNSVSDIEMSKKLKLNVRQSNRTNRKGGSCLVGISLKVPIHNELKINIEDVCQGVGISLHTLKRAILVIYLPPDATADQSIETLVLARKFLENHESYCKVLKGDFNLGAVLSFNFNEDGVNEGIVTGGSVEEDYNARMLKGNMRGKRLVATRVLDLCDQFGFQNLLVEDTYR